MMTAEFQLPYLRRISEQLAMIGRTLGEVLRSPIITRFDDWSSHLDVVLAGEYSGGKTTLLNALLALPNGCRLPTGFRPTTKLPWRLTYGARSNVWGMDCNGCKISDWTWDEATRTQDIGQHANQPDYFDVQVLSPALDVQKLAFWDTEGLDAPGREGFHEVAFDLIRDAEVLIWVCSHEVKECDREYLRKLCNNTPFARILIVMAKAPLDVTKRQEHLRFVMDNMSIDGSTDVRYLAVESRGAIEAQDDLKQLAYAFSNAVDMFIGNKDDSAVARNWSAEIETVIKKLKATGIHEVREQILQVVKDANLLLADSARRKLLAQGLSLLSVARRKQGGCEKERKELEARQDALTTIVEHDQAIPCEEDLKKHLTEELIGVLRGETSKLANSFKTCFVETKNRTEKMGVSGYIQFWKSRNRIVEDRLIKLIPDSLEHVISDFRDHLAVQMPKRLEEMIQSRLDLELVQICAVLRNNDIEIDAESITPAASMQDEDLRDYVARDLQQVKNNSAAIFPDVLAAAREPHALSATAAQQLGEVTAGAMRNSVSMSCGLWAGRYREAMSNLRERLTEITRPRLEEIEKQIRDAQLEEQHAMEIAETLGRIRTQLGGEE